MNKKMRLAGFRRYKDIRRTIWLQSETGDVVTVELPEDEAKAVLDRYGVDVVALSMEWPLTLAEGVA